jgi:ABC-type Fe3+/spermidine/putrescine transport system ATPase subunit
VAGRIAEAERTGQAWRAFGRIAFILLWFPGGLLLAFILLPLLRMAFAQTWHTLGSVAAMELRQLLRSLKATSLYVTHDHIEALVLADVLAVIRNGVIQQVDDPLHLFAHPVNAWVARFLGMQVLRPERFQDDGSGRVKTWLGRAILEATLSEHVVPGSAGLVFRPEDVHLERRGDQVSPSEGSLSVVVEAVVPLGPLFRVDLSGAASFSALLSRQEYHRLGLKRGEEVLARFEATDLLLVPESL